MKNLYNFCRTSIFNFSKSTVSNAFRGLFLIIHYFSHTSYYLLYILLSILAFFCNVDDSYISIMCKTFICVLLFSTLFLFMLLNISFTNKKIEYLLGKLFIDQYLSGHFKGLFPFLLFIVTLTMLDFIEISSMNMRVCEYQDSLNLINKNLENVGVSESDVGILNNSYDLLLKIRDLPSTGYPKTGILTDISSRICIIWVFCICS